MKKILLVEDDLDIVNHLTLFLENEGFIMRNTDGQTQAMEMIDNQGFDLVLLDLSLKEGHGFSLYHEIKNYKDIPIIFLTASNDEYSVVTGLNLGADDYIAKPFRPRELLSRIQNVLRRYQKQETIYQYLDIKLNTLTGQVYKKDREIILSALEYKLCIIFFSHIHQLLTREFLLDELWNITGEDVSDNTLSVYIKRLRYKLEDDPKNPKIIITVRGLGYKLGE
ncbi:response regulator transcription factor [Candidatus Stoquefichus massiliensis]|uniref:response regulator transcription factor n=1 Tax=Candidatus Stoquefichus massiliensis TaxID=1470350 RepID=UPI00048237F7|nr:response regulator transcription factor [Candidatus Stoquefichus massiliensis]